MVGAEVDDAGGSRQGGGDARRGSVRQREEDDVGVERRRQACRKRAPGQRNQMGVDVGDRSARRRAGGSCPSSTSG